MEVRFSKAAFVRSYVIPALVLFAVPAAGLWFSGHAVRTYDADFREGAIAAVQKDSALSPAERAEAIEGYRQVRASTVCAEFGNDVSSQPEWVQDLCGDYRQLGWMGRLSSWGLGLGLFALLVVLLCSLIAFASRPAQYSSFRTGWHLLRVVASLETVLQGVLLLMLSYWVTALWFDRYFPKLILVVGALVLVTAWRIVRAIFQAPVEPLLVEGEIIDEERAPELWKRVRAICSRLGTEPPQTIVGGIDDNFFVTEGQISLGGTILEGRTLFVSLSLLKTMDVEEADAVLAHEMAHFSGGDTQFSKKLSPLIGQYMNYLDALQGSVLSLPVFYFMLFYWSLFQLSLGRTSRQRELRADRIAAETTSPGHMAQALIKVGAYASFRGRVMESLFEHDRTHDQIGIPQRVAQGFAGYARSEKLAFDLHEAAFPHPFDTHPSLRERLANVGEVVSDTEYAEILARPVGASWFDSIAEAEALEARLWTAYEARFASAHEESLAYRYLPSTEEEWALVERHFPAIEIPGKKPGVTLRLDHRGIRLSTWDDDVPFERIKACTVNEQLFMKRLEIRLVDGRLIGGARTIRLGALQMKGDDFLALFNRYYARHQAAVAHHSETGVG
jgi:Zn-dependent protease with chaperone function